MVSQKGVFFDYLFPRLLATTEGRGGVCSCLQSEEGLLQAGAAEHHIPRLITQRLHGAWRSRGVRDVRIEWWWWSGERKEKEGKPRKICMELRAARLMLVVCARVGAVSGYRRRLYSRDRVEQPGCCTFRVGTVSAPSHACAGTENFLMLARVALSVPLFLFLNNHRSSSAQQYCLASTALLASRRPFTRLLLW